MSPSDPQARTAPVMGISEWIAVLDHGIKIAQGTATQIQSNPEVVRAYLGDRAILPKRPEQHITPI